MNFRLFASLTTDGLTTRPHADFKMAILGKIAQFQKNTGFGAFPSQMQVFGAFSKKSLDFDGFFVANSKMFCPRLNLFCEFEVLMLFIRKYVNMWFVNILLINILIKSNKYKNWFIVHCTLVQCNLVKSEQKLSL